MGTLVVQYMLGAGPAPPPWSGKYNQALWSGQVRYPAQKHLWIRYMLHNLTNGDNAEFQWGQVKRLLIGQMQ